MKGKQQQDFRVEKYIRYGIRKYSFGAASVAIAAGLMFLGNGAVSANEAAVNGTTPDSSVVASNPENDATSAKPATSVDKNEVKAEESKKVETSAQKEAEEKAKILEAQEKAEAARIDSDAQDEEITAKLAGTFTSYAFDVDRQVTVNKKIHAFKSASWSDQGEVIEPGTKLTVNKIVSPAGYLMYQISSGNLQGQFITANEKFVSVDSKNDELENFISRPVAIKFLATQNVYSDEAASKVRVTYGNGAQLNINGIGINNNRLIYHVSDGSFVPVNPVRVIEVNRETPKTKNIDSNDNKNASNSQSNQRTTR